MKLIQIDTILGVASEPRPDPAKVLPADLFSHYFARFPSSKEAAMISLVRTDRPARQLTRIPSHSLDDSSTATPAPSATLPLAKENGWLDVYQNSLKESIAAFSTGDEIIDATAWSAREDIDAADIGTGASEVHAGESRALSQENGQLSSFEQQSSTENMSEYFGPTTEPQVAGNGGAFNVTTTLESQYDRGCSSVVLPIPSLGGEVLPGSGRPNDGGFQELAWIQPHQYDFCGDFDIEMMLSERLYSGEAWIDAHVATQIASYQDDWTDSIAVGMN